MSEFMICERISCFNNLSTQTTGNGDPSDVIGLNVVHYSHQLPSFPHSLHILAFPSLLWELAFSLTVIIDFTCWSKLSMLVLLWLPRQ